MEEAQRKISSSEFAEWRVFDSIDPGEPRRSDIQAALISMIIANAHRTKGRAFELEDFLLRFGEKERKFPTAKELKLKMQSWLTSQKLMGGKLKTKDT